MKLSQIVELPEKRNTLINEKDGRVNIGYNKAIDEIADIEVDLSKMIDEDKIKDLILDYECKLNGSVLCSDEWIGYVRGISKHIVESLKQSEAK